MTRLEHFDGEDVALVLERRGLYEEAFVVLDNFNCYGEAGRVLVERIGDLERGRRYAEKCDEKEVWELVGRSLLNKGELNVECCLRDKIAPRWVRDLSSHHTCPKRPMN